MGSISVDDVGIHSAIRHIQGLCVTPVILRSQHPPYHKHDEWTHDIAEADNSPWDVISASTYIRKIGYESVAIGRTGDDTSLAT